MLPCPYTSHFCEILRAAQIADTVSTVGFCSLPDVYCAISEWLNPARWASRRPDIPLALSAYVRRDAKVDSTRSVCCFRGAAASALDVGIAMGVD